MARLYSPVEIAGFRDTGFTVGIFKGTSDFNGLENGNELVLDELGFTHDDYLRGPNQHAGSSKTKSTKSQ